MENNHIVITVSRQYGAGGRAVAEAVGKKLGIPVYDDNLLLSAAEGFGYSAEIFRKSDEKRHIFRSSHLFSSLYSHAVNYIDDDALFQMMSSVIRDIAGGGPCVIVGRCASYVLRDKENIVKVFVSSPMKIREMRVMDRMGVSRETAREIIVAKEKDRIARYERYTLGRWADCTSYHLCIDSSLLGIEGTAEQIVTLVRKRTIPPLEDDSAHTAIDDGTATRDGVSGGNTPDAAFGDTASVSTFGTARSLAERPQIAVEYFMKGYGCCQSVVAAFADLYGLPEGLALRIGAGFGGGVGRMRMMCGAASALVILAGLQCGQTVGDDREGKAGCYKVVQDLLGRFRNTNGSVICAELLGLAGPVAKGDFIPSERNAEYYKSRPCAAKVESAARIFATYLAELTSPQKR